MFHYHLAARLFPAIIWSLPAGTKAVYLTFDDGPHPVFTRLVTDILQHYNVPASFFLVGKRSLQYPALVEHLYKAGHTIGLHGVKHTRMGFQTATHLKQELRDNQRILADITGLTTRLFRPPYGHFSPHLLRICRQLAIRPVMWSCMPFDFHRRVPEQWCFHLAVRALENGTIYVLHDGHANSDRTVSLLPHLIEHIIQRGFTCLPLPDFADFISRRPVCRAIQ